MAKFFGFEKLGNLFRIIRANGGFINSFKKLYRYDDLKTGKLIGCDKYGNRYYENPYFFFGRNRWVEYADYIKMEYNGSHIPPEWHGWMHYKTDIPPSQDCSRPLYRWMLDHSENLSGTREAYMPYSTRQPKIEAWDPKKIIKGGNEIPCK